MVVASVYVCAVYIARITGTHQPYPLPVTVGALLP